MADEQIPSTFEGSPVPQIQNADITFSGDLGLVKTLKGGLPKYQGMNDYALKRRLVTDDAFFQEFTQDAVEMSMDSRLRQASEQDPEFLQTYQNNFRKNLRGILLQSSYSGETTKNTLISRTTALRQTPEDLPVDTYKDIVSRNPKAFESFGIVRDGKLVFGDGTNDGLNFATQVIQTPELHRTIVQERFNQFQEALTKSHNNPALVDDVTKQTQAFVVFDTFGDEGLTQYINLLQKEDPDTNIGERYTGLQQARDFFSRASVGGKNVYDIIDNFVTGGEEPLTFTPIQPRQDLTVNIPEDQNFYTMHYYGVEGNEFVDKDAFDSAIPFLMRHTPEEYKKFINEEDLRKDGPFSDAWSKVTWSIYNEAYEGGLYTIKDLMDTVKVHGEYQGKDRYRINVNDVPVKVQLAIDALRHDDDGNYMFQYISDGVYDFREKRREEAQNRWDKVGSWLYATKDELYTDEEGELQIRQTPETGGFAGVYNSIATVGLGVVDGAIRFGFEPLVRVTGNLTKHEGTQAFAAKLQDWTGVNMSTALSAETHGFVPNAIGEIAPFLQYMGSMMIGGAGFVRLGAKAFSAITGAKKAFDLQRYAGHMVGSGRLQAMANKLNHAVKNKTPLSNAALTSRSPWATGVGVFYSGGAIIEATQPKDMSFFNAIPQVFGYEPTNDLTKLYKTTSDHNRVAMNIGASLVLDGFFDTVIAGSKFLTAKAGQRYFGRKQFKGIEYQGIEEAGTKFNGYKVVDEPQFRHDLHEFWYNMTTGLDKLPIGTVGETMARNLVKGAPYESLHDFTKGFIDDSGYVVTNIKKDIEDNIRVLNQALGDGVALEDSAIKTLVDEQYNIFLKATADQIYGTLRTASNELPLRFAQTLDEQTPTLRVFKVNGESVPASRIGEFDGRSDTGKLMAKDGIIYEVDPQFWTIDLANAIRTSALKQLPDDVAQRKIDILGDTKTAEQVEQITNEVNEIVGTPVSVNGKTGYVVDFDDGSYTVRTSDGDIVTTSVATRLTDEQVDVMMTKATSSNVLRQRVAMGFEPQQQPRALLGSGTPPVERELNILREIDQTDTQLAEQSAQIDGRVNDLSRRYALLDDIVSDENMSPEQAKEARKLRGAQKRNITNEIKRLQSQKDEVAESLSNQKKAKQQELSQLHRDFPEIQGQRPDVVSGPVAGEFVEQNNTMARLFGEPEVRVGQRLTLKEGGASSKLGLKANTVNRIISSDDPQTQITKEYQKDPKKIVKAYEDIYDDAGYHSGSLGERSDYLTEGYDGDMPFTGYYFIGDADSVLRMDRSNRGGGKNARQVVDFSQYNLLKPTTNEYWALKFGLKRLTRGLYEGKLPIDELNPYFPSDLKRYIIENEDQIKRKFAEWREGPFDSSGRKERFETIVMKDAGYEGVDVRGLKEMGGEASPDTFTEGSVIFNLKEGTRTTLEEKLKDAKTPSRMVTHKPPKKSISRYIEAIAQDETPKSISGKYALRTNQIIDALVKADLSTLRKPFC